MCNEALTLTAAVQLWGFTKMFQIMTDHVFDFYLVVRGKDSGRAGREWDQNGFGTVLNMAPRWDSNQGQKKKREENAGKHQRHRSKLLANTQT